MNEEYHKWNSYYLHGEYEMLVFGYGGYPVIYFPMSKGRYYQAKDLGFINSASRLIESGVIKIYCPDSADAQSWYNYSIQPADRVKTQNGYENLVMKEVIDFAKHETGYDKVGVAGSCFGAYHALNLALRHPDMIDSIICLGGSFDIQRFIFGYYDDNCYFNGPLDYLPGLNDEWYLERIRQMKIHFGIGELDRYLDESIKISGLFNQKNIQHELEVVGNKGHDLNLWIDLFPRFLEKLT